ncbi:beta-1,4-mannosyl-glycoprotein 4-beta-N-acetylglucosaminyltransferase [Schistocerca piceifrons]|uniref:beta-1,4-mannosyl-glycoprotein 4-beta-N-acetylglucosaminyltransferase n=1 Tax=Schistocerca piceifrons TaxID=274613 RepID=UPI001F5E9267|nr:beta-1,4-mannosyl-glycoprotein 4-beta-N-acetylglucosaminyltransferase [Schistocerca piceifrons]XP_047119870.1 beta-1,4-mannosyl-glycoprotein 4-beta-N-acetylglucosaminyltransferase [Schistocerca piceifrons]
MLFHMNTSWTVLCMLLALQVLAAGFLLLVTAPPGPVSVASGPGTTQSTIQFLPAAQVSNDIGLFSTSQKKVQITLGKPQTANFVLQNNSLCFSTGTEPVRTITSPTNGCVCRKGWHGRDCGQPEVVWRALARHRPPLPPPTRRMQPRRLICVIEAGPSMELIEMAAQEVSSVAELIILRGEHKLRSGWCRSWCSRTLQVTAGFDWTQLVADLQPDDLISSWGKSTGFIPNAGALLFLKLYDGLPTPVLFRARWTVYGFFWMHPRHTLSATGAWLFANGREQPLNRGENFVELGDLNHYGGWVCVPCGTPSEIVSTLPLLTNHVGHENLQLPPHVDTHTVEDAMGAGVWLDGKTELLKTRMGDHEFAPASALTEVQLYDLLFKNYYDRVGLDY